MENAKRSALICTTWKTKTLAAVLAVVAAVALPQIVHFIGHVSGLGSATGETFLPMHLAIFLVGFFAGPWAGLAAGALSPALSFGLTSLWNDPMPALQMLPFMMIELAVYGLTTGLFAQYVAKLPAIVTLLAAQIAGRAVRALALTIGVYGFGSPVNISVIWTSLLTGLPGLILQWVIVPLLVYWVAQRAKHE